MKCSCGARLSCLDTRSRDNRTTRRYRCPKCEAGFTSQEIIIAGTRKGYKVESLLVVDLRQWKAKLAEEIAALIQHKGPDL